MNLILVAPSEISGNRVVLAGRRAKHIANVIAPSVGDSLRIGVIGAGRGPARVESVTGERVELVVGELAADAARPPTHLVLAVPRPKVLARVVAAAAAQGVSTIDLTNAWRVEKSFFASPVLAPSALDEAAITGCEQGGLTQLPPLVVHRRFMAWLATLAPPNPRREIRVVAHPGAERSFADFAPIATAMPVRLCIGPEGGWIERELASLAAAGFAEVRIADTALRVETAIAATLGQIDLCRRLPSENQMPRSKGPT